MVSENVRTDGITEYQPRQKPRLAGGLESAESKLHTFSAQKS